MKPTNMTASVSTSAASAWARKPKSESIVAEGTSMSTPYLCRQRASGDGDGALVIDELKIADLIDDESLECSVEELGRSVLALPSMRFNEL